MNENEKKFKENLKMKPRTPSAAEKANTPLKAKEIELPSGAIATCIEAKGKHVVEAQRLMDQNPDLMMTALITVCSTINGKRPTMEEVLEMPYLDYMMLIGEFQSGGA